MQVTLQHLKNLVRGIKMFLGKRSTTLVAGPWIGEFGWELMQWQGYVRWRKERYDKTYVITYENREYLYEGCIVCTHNFKLENSGFAQGHLDESITRALIDKVVKEEGIKDYDLFTPEDTMSRFTRGKQRFVKFHEPPLDGKTYDIAFHFRDLVREDGDDFKNYPREKVTELVNFCMAKGMSVCCIGHPALSFCPSYCEDRRSHKLKNTVATICASSLVVGASSAPMHLASLCGTPILTWAGPFIIERYLSYWNPFHSKVFVVTDETFDPDVSMVTGKIEEIFDQRLLSGGDCISHLETGARPEA